MSHRAHRAILHIAKSISKSKESRSLNSFHIIDGQVVELLKSPSGLSRDFTFLNGLLQKYDFPNQTTGRYKIDKSALAS